jgi:hypothetical protein
VINQTGFSGKNMSKAREGYDYSGMKTPFFPDKGGGGTFAFSFLSERSNV